MNTTTLVPGRPHYKQSHRMKHFCLPITNGSTQHSSTSTSRKLQKKKNTTARHSVDTTARSTLRDSQATIRAKYDANENRLSLARTVRSTDDNQDKIWRAYPAQLDDFLGFEHDDELNDSQGDCLVFFHTPDSKVKRPLFQLSSEKIRGANIAFLNDLLRAGCRDTTASGRYTVFPRTDRLVRTRKELKRHSQFLPAIRTLSPMKLFESTNNLHKRISWAPGVEPCGTMYVQEVAKIEEEEEEEEEVEDEEHNLDRHNVKYEMWFAVPAYYDEKHKHDYRLAVRNLFAIMHKKPIVGHDLVRSLRDVQDVMDAFDISTIALPRHKDSAVSALAIPDTRLIITEYVREMRLDDMRFDMRQALRMLAWTESPNVRWSEGYLEIFVHVVGMMRSELTGLDDFRALSPLTQANLKNAHDALQLIIEETEEKLKDCSFDEMWILADTKPKEHNPAAPQWHAHRQAVSARRAAEEFRAFIITYYVKLFGSWPPPTGTEHTHWLNRIVVHRLQTDFGLLYEYLVDKDITWDQMAAVYRREWEIVDKHNVGFKADQHAPITDMIVHFDNANDLLHVPHPFPLLPAEEVTLRRRSIFNALSVRNRATESCARMSLFAQASNMDLDRDCMCLLHLYHLDYKTDLPLASHFLDAFKQHEATFSEPGVSAQEARLGRWILLYGLLQTLSHLSVDVPGLRYTDDIEYFLCFGLNGHPSWASHPARSTVKMPAQESSYCWTIAERWYARPYNVSIVPSTHQEPVDEEEVSSPADSGIGNCTIDTAKANQDISFVMPSGSLIPAPHIALRPSPMRATFAPSITSSSSITALPQIPERSSLRNSRISMEQKRMSITSNGGTNAGSRSARVSITPSLRSEGSAADRAQDRKKRETLVSMEGTEWADTEFSGEEAMAVPLRSGVRGTLVERAMSSKSTIE